MFASEKWIGYYFGVMVGELVLYLIIARNHASFCDLAQRDACVNKTHFFRCCADSIAIVSGSFDTSRMMFPSQLMNGRFHCSLQYIAHLVQRLGL